MENYNNNSSTSGQGVNADNTVTATAVKTAQKRKHRPRTIEELRQALANANYHMDVISPTAMADDRRFITINFDERGKIYLTRIHVHIEDLVVLPWLSARLAKILNITSIFCQPIYYDESSGVVDQIHDVDFECIDFDFCFSENNEPEKSFFQYDGEGYLSAGLYTTYDLDDDDTQLFLKYLNKKLQEQKDKFSSKRTDD